MLFPAVPFHGRRVQGCHRSTLLCHIGRPRQRLVKGAARLPCPPRNLERHRVSCSRLTPGSRYLRPCLRPFLRRFATFSKPNIFAVLLSPHLRSSFPLDSGAGFLSRPPPGASVTAD